jgi:diacylglycerol kinase family enzyme
VAALGIYATVVQEDSYREAKVDTAKKLLPDLLSSTAEPFDLQFTDPDGNEIDGAFLIMVSNNPYISGLSPDSFQRRVIDSGQLGVMAVNTDTGAAAAALLARAALGVVKRDPHLHEFACTEFQVRSRSGSAFAGVDGEALDLPTPLEFRIHPGGLQLLVPQENIVIAEKRRHRGFSLADLLSVAAPPSEAEPPSTRSAGRGFPRDQSDGPESAFSTGWRRDQLPTRRFAPSRW